MISKLYKIVQAESGVEGARFLLFWYLLSIDHTPNQGPKTNAE
jgi:hypothetical protein